MHILLKNKYLYFSNYKVKCTVGKRGITAKKREGDYSTPKGLFKLDKLYFRKDRIGKIKSKIKKKIINKNMGWCDDPNHKRYNEEIIVTKKSNKEIFYRKDNKYDYLITINHNHKKIPFKGSAIFIHLTTNYKPTAGCIALKKKDFEVLLTLIDQKTKIKIG